jgi:hypothetical protein
MKLWGQIKFRLRAVTDHRYRQFFLQRQVTDLPARERRADAVARRLPASNKNGNGIAAEGAAALQKDGYWLENNLIKPEWLPEMVAYFEKQQCSDPYQPKLGPFNAPAAAPKNVHVAYFSNEIVARAPHTFAIANNETVLSVVSEMLGAKPTISYMTAWWSLPADGTAQQAENFHRDVDDWRFVKLFCYLTDVDETAGPHVFVLGSHRTNRLTEIRRFTNEEVADTFGASNIHRFSGPAGTAFLENTYGIHRGIPPSKKPRLIFQVLYSLRPTIYGPKSPVARIGVEGIPENIDPYINRVYCAER